jgi:hypothetical protein
MLVPTAKADPSNGTYYCKPLGEGNAPLVFSSTTITAVNPDGSYGKPVDVKFSLGGDGSVPMWTALDGSLVFIFRENQIYVLNQDTREVLGKMVCE